MRRRMTPARPLTGYRDMASGEPREARAAHLRAWAILGVLVLVYLGWTLTVYFLEPGLR